MERKKDKEYCWDKKKNKTLKEQRGIGFEDVVWALENRKLLATIKSPSPDHPNQFCYVLEINDYVYIVPFVESEESVFFKTIYPSRKYKKIYS